MQEAGIVLHLARSGRLILKASVPAVSEGTILVDEKGRRTGKVMELIGPSSSPYLSVQPFTDRIERISGSKLFVSDEQDLGRRPPRDAGRRGSSYGRKGAPGKRSGGQSQFRTRPNRR